MVAKRKKEQSWDEIGKAIGKKIDSVNWEECAPWKKNKKVQNIHNSSMGAIYFLGFIGALIYYVTTSTGFWNIFLGFLKAIVWPAFLVFEAFKFLGA